MKAYVYMLRCVDGSFYTGWTNDPVKRLKAHQAGKGGRYTRAHLPVEPVYLESFDSKEEAMAREYALKLLSHGEKLKLIRESPLTF